VTRVLVAAASAVTRAGLEAILGREPSLTIVGRGATHSTLADEVSEHEPDVVLVELAGSDDDQLPMLHLLSADFDDGARPAPVVVVLTDERDASHVGEALRSGVRALLPRDARAGEIIAAVNAAASGLVAFSGELFDMVRSALVGERSARNGVASASGDVSLTPRELEVLRMVADGLANKQIAARLAISEHTVKFHIGSVFAKMHASTRAEAVMIGARRGLIVL
jgi:NarL family two-component system response regulator YdfI